MATRTRSGRFTRRRYRKNPPKMTPALRAKIGRRVKAAMRAKKMGGHRRTRTRTRVRTVVRRSAPVVRYRTRTRRIVRYRARRHAMARRHHRRRSAGSRGVSIPIGVKSVFSKDTLTIAGGAIGSGLLTSIVLNRFGTMLPMSGSPIGGIFYRLAIPVGGAYVVNKFLKQRKLAEGMIIGGVVLALNQVINLYLPQVGAAVNATPAPAIAPTGEYLGALPPMNASYDATSTFGAPPSSISSEPAFPDSAWS